MRRCVGGRVRKAAELTWCRSVRIRSRGWRCRTTTKLKFSGATQGVHVGNGIVQFIGFTGDRILQVLYRITHFAMEVAANLILGIPQRLLRFIGRLGYLPFHFLGRLVPTAF